MIPGLTAESANQSGWFDELTQDETLHNRHPGGESNDPASPLGGVDIPRVRSKGQMGQAASLGVGQHPTAVAETMATASSDALVCMFVMCLSCMRYV